MKKISLLILTILIVLGSYGCFFKKYVKYDTVVCNGSASIERYTWSYDVYQNNSEEKDVKENIEIEFEGITYNGTYVNTTSYQLSSYKLRNYVDDNNNKISVSSKDGSLKAINFMTKEFFETEPYLPELENKFENAFNKAREYASKYVDDIKNYVVEVSEPITRYKEKDGIKYEITYFDISYVRYVDGMKTSDLVSVRMTSKGNLASLFIGDINSIKIKEKYKIEKVDEIVKEKIQGESNPTVKIKEFNVTKRELYCHERGCVCLMSYVDLVLETPEGDVQGSTMAYTILDTVEWWPLS